MKLMRNKPRRRRIHPVHKWLRSLRFWKITTPTQAQRVAGKYPGLSKGRDIRQEYPSCTCRTLLRTAFPWTPMLHSERPKYWALRMHT